MTLIRKIMKKINYILAAFAALAALSCAKELRPDTEGKAEKGNEPKPEVVWTLNAGFPQEGVDQVAPASRTALNGTKVSWTAGDQIVVNGVTSLALEAENITNEGASATFEFSSIPEGDTLVAVYPASVYSVYQDSLEAVTFPAHQTYDPATQQFDPSASILLGQGTGAGCTFRHAAAYLKITCDQPVKSIRVMANCYNTNSDTEMRAGMAVSGIRTVNFDQPFLTDAVLVDNGSSTEISFGEGVPAGTPIVLSMPPRNFRDGLNFMVITTDGKYQIFRSSSPVQLAGKLGKLLDLSLSLNNLKDYAGPGIYSADDYEAFVYSYECQDPVMMDRFRDESGVFHLRADISGINFTRLGANAGKHAGDAGSNITFSDEFNGHGYAIHQDSSRVALFSSLDSEGYIHDLVLTGKFVKIPNTGWGTANLAIRNHGEIRNCVNRVNISINESESEPGSGAVLLTGFVTSNAGVMRDCINYGNIEANLFFKGSNRDLLVGAFAAAGNHDGECGNFENCDNHGSITIKKITIPDGAYQMTRSLQCGIGGICGKVDDGSIASRGNPNVVEGKYYARTPEFCFFENCRNYGGITYWEDDKTNNSPIGVGGILGRCCKTDSKKESFDFSGYDGYYMLINYNCQNYGTLDVSSSGGQLAATNISGARELYIGGIAGVVHGICSKKGGYAIVRGRSNCTIKLGSSRGGEVAGGIIGGACIAKIEMSNTDVVFEKTGNTLFAPDKVGYAAACVGLVIKRCVIYGGTSLEHANSQFKMDASGLNGYTVVGTGFGGVTSHSSTYTYHNAWDAEGNYSDADQKTPYIILEVAGDTKYFNFTGTKPDGSSFATGLFTSSNKADCDAVYAPGNTNKSWRSTTQFQVNAGS